MTVIGSGITLQVRDYDEVLEPHRDITKLHGPWAGWPVGWMAATCESATLAEELITATCAKQGIGRGQLSIHADRGSSMTSKPVALLLADLGVTQYCSRPHVSNDNPYSEAQFKTLRYRPGFPARFGSIEAARARAGTSSPRTTTSIITAGSACTPPPTSTTAGPPPSGPAAPRSWTLPISPTPNASSANRRPRRNCQAHPGSTRPRTRKSALSKTRVTVPHSR